MKTLSSWGCRDASDPTFPLVAPTGRQGRSRTYLAPQAPGRGGASRGARALLHREPSSVVRPRAPNSGRAGAGGRGAALAGCFQAGFQHAAPGSRRPPGSPGLSPGESLPPRPARAGSCRRPTAPPASRLARAQSLLGAGGRRSRSRPVGAELLPLRRASPGLELVPRSLQPRSPSTCGRKQARSRRFPACGRKPLPGRRFVVGAAAGLAVGFTCCAHPSRSRSGRPRGESSPSGGLPARLPLHGPSGPPGPPGRRLGQRPRRTGGKAGELAAPTCRAPGEGAVQPGRRGAEAGGHPSAAGPAVRAPKSRRSLQQQPRRSFLS